MIAPMNRLVVCFTCVLVIAPAALYAQATPPAARGWYDWGLKLPERAVPRRASHGGVRMPLDKPLVVADVAGPGCLRHFWVTGVHPGRQMTLRIYFDEQAERPDGVPHVEAPLSDFFGVMHDLAGRGESYRVNTPFFAVKPKNAFTCYLPMPFARRARVEIEREHVYGEPENGDVLYCILDWHEYPGQTLEEPQRFCARWRRESPVRDYADDFIVADIDGPGRLVGFVHSIDMLVSRFQMRWSHAGADNLYIDGDGPRPAYLRGIGGEDSFGTSFGGNEYVPGTSLFSDMPYYVQKDDAGDKQKLVGYRFFVEDAITFEKSLHMRFGSRAHDVATTTYWYSSAPVHPYYKLPPPAKRKFGSEVLRGEFDLPLPDTGKWEVAGPDAIDAKPEPPGDGDWRPLDAIRGFVEFNHVFRPEATNSNSPTLVDVAAWARSTLDAPRATTAKLTLGWDDELSLWVNGEKRTVFGAQAYLKGHTIEVPLKEGANEVLVRLTNTTGQTRGAWNFSFSAKTADGETILPARN
jgi:hypothetical protein